MPTVYSKNCILRGDLDSYCLACSSHLPGVEEVLTHIRQSEHEGNLKSVHYFEKYKDDFIKKVNGVYFCHVCNMTFATAAKVAIHVREDEHIDGKRRQLERVGTSVVFQKKTFIDENTWNGLVEDTCVLCNEEFDDPSAHKSNTTHMYNVVRSKVTIDDNNNIYRKFDGDCHCLICNTVVSDNIITEHLTSDHHKSAKQNLAENGEGNNKDKNEGKIKKKEDGVLTKETSKQTVDIKPLIDIITSANAERQVSMKEKDKASTTSITKEMEMLTKQHGLSINKLNNTVDCKACGLQVPATLSCMKEHVAGKKHKAKSSKASVNERDEREIKKIKHEHFCKKAVVVDTVFGQVVVINNTLCVESVNFVFLKNCGKIVCEFCNVDFPPTQRHIKEHLGSSTHKSMLLNSLVIASLETEFVRQVNSSYHCGYCGRVESDYDDLLDHLETAEHKLHKSCCQWILDRLIFENLMERGVLFNPLEFFNLSLNNLNHQF